MPPPTFIDHLRRTEGHRGRAKLPHLTKTVRSGLSPIRRPERETRQTHHTDAIWAALTAEYDIESQNHKAEESHQRWKFRGFTSLELEDLGALPTMSDENFKKPTLDNPIHPIFERKKWKEKDPWQPLGNGRPGNWVASNDLVWEAMQPSLRLATLFLTNFHIFPWIDAALHGPKTWMPSPPAAAAEHLGRFHRRKPEELAEAKKDPETFKAALQELVKKVRWKFDNGSPTFKPTHGGTVCPGTGILGITYTWGNRIHVKIAYQFIEPLLAKEGSGEELSRSMRALHEFNIAKTVIHELTHCISRCFHMKTEYRKNAELFFEDELVCEMGRSWETAIFGGQISPPFLVIDSADEITTGVGTILTPFVMSSTWPSRQDHQKLPAASQSRIIAAYVPELLAGFNLYRFPISMRWIEDLWQRDFWEIEVAQYGAEVVRPAPYGLGLRARYLEDGLSQKTRKKLEMVRGRDYEDIIVRWEDYDKNLREIGGGGKALRMRLERLEHARAKSWNFNHWRPEMELDVVDFPAPCTYTGEPVVEDNKGA